MIRWAAVLATSLFAAAAASAQDGEEAPATVPADPAGLPADTTDPDAYDPLEGMDPDGRIPSIEKPADLPNPERWRYIPEGRIKPGNVFQRFLVSSFIVPFVFRSSDVGWGGGIAITDIDFRTQRRREFAGIFLSYTEEGQQSYSIAWRRWLHHRDLPQGGVLQEERTFVRAAAGYSKTLTRRFFGIGPDTGHSDESSYRDEAWVVDAGIQHTWPDPGDDLVFRFGLRGEFHDLGGGEVSGEPDTGDAYPAIFDKADPHDLGWLRAGVSYDTRDSQRNPYRGWQLSADAAAALLQSGGDVGALYTLSGSKLFGVPPIFHDGGDEDEENPPTDTLAIGMLTQLSSGDLPFFVLPSLGGDNFLRGFIGGRFRDRALWTAGIEHRFWIIARGIGIPFTKAIRIERLGAAIFYEAGSVADDGRALFDARVRHSYGFGFRLLLERAAPFRLDVGFSQDGVNLSARFGLSF